MPDGLTVTADRNYISRLQVLFLKQGIDRISKKSPELSIKLSKLRKCKLLALANIQYSLFQRHRDRPAQACQLCDPVFIYCRQHNINTIKAGA
ncbi:Uncharacterised protein [Shigella sonnei]|nr:Uncharacterised protein [Shigella sonnei]CSE98028.1 Uncharacterised protein [Shigella sonnei]CSF04542.1 Uncharacterised protein [Shigella sonnei]CSF20034.1 Uncharacterised protein [Shigella sonnei]CSF25825.1 Uncharacterised protein [Shigella sonnei]